MIKQQESCQAVKAKTSIPLRNFNAAPSRFVEYDVSVKGMIKTKLY
jgi:hypothetical protein